MYLDSRNQLATARLNPLGLGPSSFLENQSAAFAATKFINRQVSEQVNRTDAYDDYIDHIYKTTGKRLDNPMGVDFVTLRQQHGNNIGRARATQGAAFHAEADALAESTGRFVPRSAESIQTSIAARAGTLEQQRAEVGSRAGFAGVVGGFIGDMGAYMTDPVIAISSLYAPARGVGVLRTLVELSLIAGGAETVVQPTIQRYRGELGLEHGFAQGAANVAMATAAGGVLGVGAKLAGMGMRRLLDIHAELRTGNLTPEETIARSVVQRAIDEEAFNAEAVPSFARQAAAAAENGEAITSFRVSGEATARLETEQLGGQTSKRIRDEALAGLPDEAPSPLAAKTAPAAVAAPAKLPRALAGAKPRWRASELAFESDVDRALFIVSQTKKSARDADYREWLRRTLGVTDEDVTRLAKETRQRIKATAKGVADGDLITIQAQQRAVPEKLPQARPGVRVRDLTPDEAAAKIETLEAAVEVLKDSTGAIPEGLAETLAYLRGNKAMPEPGLSLVGWIIKNGGIRDTGGDLAGYLGSTKVRPGLINNREGTGLEGRTKKGFAPKRGMNLEDEVGLRAAEAGYFPKIWDQIQGDGVAPTTREEVMEAIANEITHGQKLYVLNEAEAVASEVDSAVRQLDAELTRLDIDADLPDAEIAKALDEGLAGEFQAVLDADPETTVPIDFRVDENGRETAVTATAREVQNDFDVDQTLIDELKSCYGWSL